MITRTNTTNPFITTLCDDVVLLILDWLTPEQLITLSEVDLYFNDLSDNQKLWEKRFAIHFPHLLRGIRHLNKTIPDWRELFGTTYHSEYTQIDILPYQARLFSQAKEGFLCELSLSLKNLVETNPNQADPTCQDRHGWNVSHWAQQSCLDFIARHPQLDLEHNGIENKALVETLTALINLSRFDDLLLFNNNLSSITLRYLLTQKLVDPRHKSMLDFAIDVIQTSFKVLSENSIATLLKSLPIPYVITVPHTRHRILITDTNRYWPDNNEFEYFYQQLFHQALYFSLYDIAEAILKRWDHFPHHLLSNTSKIIAAKNDPSAVEFLISKGADINLAENELLRSAAENGSDLVIEALLKHEATNISPIRFSDSLVLELIYHFIPISPPRNFSRPIQRDYEGNVADQCISVTRLNEKTINLLLLAEFIQEVKAGKIVFGTPFQFFTKHITPSTSESLEAARALRNVMLFDADPAILDEHENALNVGRLGNIYNRLKNYFPSPRTPSPQDHLPRPG